MAQAKKITLTFTPKQMEDFLQKYVCKAALKDAKKDLLARQVTEKAAKPSKPALKKQDSSSELAKYKKMKADEVEALAKKKAKKAKEDVPHKGKKPTKQENIDYLTDGGNTTDSGKKDKKPASKELQRFCAKVGDSKKVAKMSLDDLKKGAKLEGFDKCQVQYVRAVATAIAKHKGVKIPNKAKTPTKQEYLDFISGKANGVKEAGKGKGKEKAKPKPKSKGKKEEDPDSEEDTPSDTDSDSDSDSGSDSSDSDSSDSDSSDSDSSNSDSSDSEEFSSCPSFSSDSESE
jgi:hypothetical protein